MSFGQSISHVLKNLTNFEGRASRSEFWWWYLAIVILALIVDVIAWAVSGSNMMSSVFGVLFFVVYVVVALATLAVGVRRFHDTGRSGWWWFLWLVCCVGPIILIVFWASPSTGPNQYGDAAASA
jgi:uncharacterized membrane protein YhaH (DUF805 family)